MAKNLLTKEELIRIAEAEEFVAATESHYMIVTNDGWTRSTTNLLNIIYRIGRIT